jgi:hypothetical protein
MFIIKNNRNLTNQFSHVSIITLNCWLIYCLVIGIFNVEISSIMIKIRENFLISHQSCKMRRSRQRWSVIFLILTILFFCLGIYICPRLHQSFDILVFVHDSSIMNSLHTTVIFNE